MKRPLLLIILFISFFTPTFCQLSTYSNKPVPKSYLIKSNPLYLSEMNQLAIKAFDLTKLLPNGYIKNGTKDYTKYLQEGIDKYSIVKFPDFPIMVNGLKVNDGNICLFMPHSKLVMQKTNKERYQILAIHGVQNVSVYFPNLIGDRRQHIGTKGEWGFGIDIRSSKNIKIIGAKVSDCWGDGIIISSTKNGMLPGTKVLKTENILIQDAFLDNNRRNGISIINVDGLKILNTIIANTNGTLPMAGIDIEPDNSQGILNNIEIKNIVTFNNKNVGIDINLGAFIGRTSKTTNILIDGHIDDSSNIGLYLAGYILKDFKPSPLEGQISIMNSTWKNNKIPFQSRNKHGYVPGVKLGKFSVYKRNEVGASQKIDNPSKLIDQYIQNKNEVLMQ